MAGEPQTTRQLSTHKLIAQTPCISSNFLLLKKVSFRDAKTHIFKVWNVIVNKPWGRSLGRYDDGLQKVANGFTDLKKG